MHLRPFISWFCAQLGSSDHLITQYYSNFAHFICFYMRNSNANFYRLTCAVRLRKNQVRTVLKHSFAIIIMFMHSSWNVRYWVQYCLCYDMPLPRLPSPCKYLIFNVTYNFIFYSERRHLKLYEKIMKEIVQSD